MAYPKLALARVNYSQLYGVYDKGKTYKKRDILAPYHLLTLAAYVRKHSAEVRIFDGELNLLSQAKLAREILNWKPDYVGLTATTPDIELTIDVCRLIKDSDSSIVTIVGGPHASAMPGDVASHKCVDYVVTGDGEGPLMKIIEHGKEPVGKKIINGKRQDIAIQPMPAHDLLDYSLYQFTDPTRGQLNTASVMSTRGCPFNCFFCFHDRHVRYRDVNDFISEIEYLYKEKGVKYYYIYDDTFMVNKDRVLEITKRIKALSLKGANFQCLTRANLVEPRIIEALRDANFTRVSMGLESCSNDMLKIVSNGEKREDYVGACKTLVEYGIETRSSFILGLPHETPETIDETINFSKELDLLHANFNIMTPYPGTRVYEMALRGEGIYFEKEEYARQWQTYRRWGKAIIRTDKLSAGDLEKFQTRAQVEFYTQPKILNYYQSLFDKGNTSRYFYRPINFAWQKKFGQDIPFWDKLEGSGIVSPDTK